VIEETTSIRGLATGGGLSYVVELGSPKAAVKELAHDVRSNIAAQGKGALNHRFTFAGVPGAVGFTARTAHKPGGAANVSFREGNCVLLVGDSPGEGRSCRTREGWGGCHLPEDPRHLPLTASRWFQRPLSKRAQRLQAQRLNRRRIQRFQRPSLPGG
jgi:hypothetical protein